jgi:non-specific serine/threonine protein kinase
LLDGKAREAARLIGVLDGMEERTGAGPSLGDRLDYERQVRAVRARLDPAALATALAEGRTLDPMEAITAAVDELMAEGRDGAQPSESTPTRPHLTRREAAKAQWNGLTARERDVAALVAQGKSNREIAEDLVVSERTVDAHLVNILGKLEFKSRTQVAAWAIGKGLGRLPRP